jgi:hypothetical protein
MSQIKKISVAKVYGKIDKKDLLSVVDGKIIANKEPLFVMRVGGLAVGTKDGMSDNGPWTSLLGDFVAYGAKDGEEHRAPICFLPDVALTPIKVALAQAGTSGVKFLIDLMVNYAEATGGREHIGYEYTFRSVVNASGEDPVAALLALAPPMTIAGKSVGGTLAIEAPKQPTAPKKK